MISQNEGIFIYIFIYMSVSITSICCLALCWDKRKPPRPLKCSCLTVYIFVQGVACLRSDTFTRNTIGSLCLPQLFRSSSLRLQSTFSKLCRLSHVSSCGVSLTDTHGTLAGVQSEGWEGEQSWGSSSETRLGAASLRPIQSRWIQISPHGTTESLVFSNWPLLLISVGRLVVRLGKMWNYAKMFELIESESSAGFESHTSDTRIWGMRAKRGIRLEY